MAEQETTATLDIETETKQTGEANPAFEEGETISEKPAEKPTEDELPPLTYIDFVPQCLGSSIEGKKPDFDTFK